MLADSLVVAVTAAVVVPALVRAFRARSGEGLSAGTQTAQLAMGGVWLWYYVQSGLRLAVWVGCASLVMFVVLTWLAWFRGGVRDTPWALVGVLLLVLLAGVLFGLPGVAVGLGVSPLLVEAPQVWSLLRRDAVALSRAAYMSAFVEAAAWGPVRSAAAGSGCGSVELLCVRVDRYRVVPAVEAAARGACALMTCRPACLLW